MTTIRQLIQTSPTLANGLFAKLVDTSDTAVKTRERLYTELKQELEFLASLEEQHLFPVLRKHKELKDLVREALNDNKATRKLLAELDTTPKDTEEFGVRVAELRKVFQQHVRDEKKELLPAILQALTDEEAQGVVENIQADMAEAEEAKRAETEERRAEARGEREKLAAEQASLEEAERAEKAQRRAAARQERERVERAEAATETMVNAAWAGPRTAQRTATAATQSIQDGIGGASHLMSSAGENAWGALNTVHQQQRQLGVLAAENLQTFVGPGLSSARNMQDFSAALVDLSRQRWEKNLAGVMAMLGCRTMTELWARQNTLLLENLELTVAEGRRLVAVAKKDRSDEAA